MFDSDIGRKGQGGKASKPSTVQRSTVSDVRHSRLDFRGAIIADAGIGIAAGKARGRGAVRVLRYDVLEKATVIMEIGFGALWTDQGGHLPCRPEL
jgi:hypothetical protein